jgi:hypothetical protein
MADKQTYGIFGQLGRGVGVEFPMISATDNNYETDNLLNLITIKPEFNITSVAVATEPYSTIVVNGKEIKMDEESIFQFNEVPVTSLKLKTISKKGITDALITFYIEPKEG